LEHQTATGFNIKDTIASFTCLKEFTPLNIYHATALDTVFLKENMFVYWLCCDDAWNYNTFTAW